MELPVNRFKKGMQHKGTLGVWSMSGSPLVAEALGCAGYDFVVLDMEHAPNDVPRLLPLLQAVAGTPAASLVRLPWNDTVVVKQVLDIGANSIMFPYVQNAEEARRAVAATRYPPDGVRGVAGMSRATRFGGVSGYFGRAADELCVVLQLETVEAIASLAEIAAVPGVDSIFIGPSDLSASMGLVGQVDHPEVQKALANAAKACAAAGKPAGILASGAARAADYFGYGFSWVASGSDLGLMMGAARAEVRAIGAGKAK
jgi:2-dehydro-3-deoxyglucarate aldolase/4-hydroxy-2-oxoheptanedioate aldolase